MVAHNPSNNPYPAGDTTIASGGTAQNLFAGNVPPTGFEVVNPDASEVLWISDSATAVANGVGAIPVPALGSYRTAPGYAPLGPVSAIAATTGHKITAKMW